MAADESIGGVSVNFTANLDDLEAQVQKAEEICAKAGTTIGDAMAKAFEAGAQSAAEAVNQIVAAAEAEATAMQGMGGAAQQAAEQLSLFDEAAHVDYSDATGQLSLFATELEPIGAAASNAAAGVADFGSAVDAAERPIGSTVVATNELGDAAHHAAEGGHEAHDSWAEFGSELAGLVGISLTIEGLIDLAKEALNAADAITKTTIALEAITGSGEKAKEILEGLEKLGMEDGLRMPGLREAAVQMENMLPVGTDVVAVLGHIADGAAVMGKSLEQSASAFDRMVEGGSLAVRGLNTLGLRMDDIGKAMVDLGASADEMAKGVKGAFSDLDKEGRVAVLTEALGKLDGVAKRVADETFSGAWNRAANQFEKDMEQMGSAIMPMALQSLPAVESAMKGVLAAAVLVGTGLQVLVDGVVGLTTVALTSIKGLAQAWADAMSGNFKGAIATATQAFDDVKAAAKFSWDSIITDSTKGAEVLAKLYATDIPKDTKTAGASVDDLAGHFTASGKVIADVVIRLTQATHDLADNMGPATDRMAVFAAAADAAQVKLDLLATQSLHANANLLTADATLKDMVTQFQAGAVGIDAVTTAENNLVKAAAAAAAQQELLNAAIAKVEGLVSAAGLAKLFQDTATAVNQAGDAIKNLGGSAAQAAPAISPLNQAMIDFGLNAGKAKTAVMDLHTPVETLVADMGLLAEKARDSKDWTPVIAALDDFDKRIQLLSKTDLPEAARQMETWIQGLINSHVPTELVQGQLDKLQVVIQKMAKEGLPEAAAAWQQYLALLNQVPNTLGDIYAKEAAGAQQEIVNAEKRGEGAEQWIVKLKEVQLQQEALKIQADGMGRVYTGLIDDVLKGFDDMGKAVADNIIDGKNWGQVWDNLLKNFAKSILETVIHGALDQLKGAILEMLLGQAKAQSAAAITTAGLNAMGPAATSAAAALTTLSEAANASAAQLGAPAAGGKDASGLAKSVGDLASTINVITGIIQAGAAVAETILLAHISSDTGHIEVNTRGSLAEALNLRADLWQQHNTLYDRLGECKNDLDGILDALRNTAAGPSGLPDEAMRDLGTLPEILGAVLAVNSSVISVLGDLNMVVLGIQNVNSTVYQVHNDIGVMIGQLNTVVTAILYGSKALSQDIGQMNASATAHTNAITGIIGRVGGDIQSAEHQQTNTLGQDLGLVAAATSSVNSSVNNVLHQMVQSDANQGGYVANSTTQIVSAVYGAGSMIANAVGVAIASIGGYNSAPGGGTTQYIPKKTPPTYQQGTESQNPGNSNSPTGNTGSTETTGAQGGYSVPKHQDIPPPITGSTQYAPGSTTQNGGNAPYNPLDPFTWTASQNPNTPSKGGSTNQPAQYDPYHIPGYDGGGIVGYDQMAMIHKDEMVLPPDLSLMLRRMASAPNQSANYPTYAGAPGVSQGAGETKIYLPVTFNGVTNSRQLLDMWTSEVKKIIPRATVFSS